MHLPVFLFFFFLNCDNEKKRFAFALFYGENKFILFFFSSYRKSSPFFKGGGGACATQLYQNHYRLLWYMRLCSYCGSVQMFLRSKLYKFNVLPLLKLSNRWSINISYVTKYLSFLYLFFFWTGGKEMSQREKKKYFDHFSILRPTRTRTHLMCVCFCVCVYVCAHVF